MDISPERVATAETLGCDLGLVADGNELDSIKEYTNGHGVEVSLECSASQPGRMLSGPSLGQGRIPGRTRQPSFNPSFTVIQKNSSRCTGPGCPASPKWKIRSSTSCWKIRPEEIVTHTFPITQVKEAFELSDSGEAEKSSLYGTSLPAFRIQPLLEQPRASSA